MVAALYAKLYWTLLAAFCVMGLCLAFAQPVFSVPDEPAHWQNAHYRIEHFLGVEGCVPVVLGGACPKRKACSSIPRMELACTNGLDIYGGITTYPGVLLSKLLLPRQNESARRQVQAIMLSRLLHGLIILLCLMRAGVLAMRGRRHGLLVMAAFMLSPLVAQQSFAVSSDCAQIAFGVCLFSAVVSWSELGWLDLALFSVLGFCATAKPSLLPCILPSVFAGHWFAQVSQPNEPGLAELMRGLWRAIKPSRRPSVQTLMLWSALLISLLTVAFSLHHDDKSNANLPPEPARVTNGALLRKNPWFIFELLRTLRWGPLQVGSWIGPLGWLDLELAPVILHTFERILLIMLAIELGVWVLQLRGARLHWRATLRYLLRALPGLAIGLTGPAANVVFMTVVMYLLWSREGSPYAAGVQIRYFIPAALVTIGVLLRLLDGMVSKASCSDALPTSTRGKRLFWAAAFVAHGLVVSLSLPYVARVFVDISTRYHNPARY